MPPLPSGSDSDTVGCPDETNPWRSWIVGLDERDAGTRRFASLRYVNFDNAASTPAPLPVALTWALTEFLGLVFEHPPGLTASRSPQTSAYDDAHET